MLEETSTELLRITQKSSLTPRTKRKPKLSAISAFSQKERQPTPREEEEEAGSERRRDARKERSTLLGEDGETFIKGKRKATEREVFVVERVRHFFRSTRAGRHVRFSFRRRRRRSRVFCLFARRPEKARCSFDRVSFLRRPKLPRAMITEAILAVAAARKGLKKKTTTTTKRADDSSMPSWPENDDNDEKTRGRMSNSEETFETTTRTTTTTSKEKKEEDTSESDEEEREQRKKGKEGKEDNKRKRLRRKRSPTDTDDDEALMRQLCTQRQQVKQVKKTNTTAHAMTNSTAPGAPSFAFGQSADSPVPIAHPFLTIEQIQQLLTQQQLLQMQQLQQRFALQQQELLKNPPKDFTQTFQFLQQQQVAFNSFNSNATTAVPPVMMNLAAPVTLPPNLLNPLSLAMNGSKLSQNAMKQSDNISFKSIMSQQFEGSIDQQTEDEEGEAFSFQQQSEDGGLIAAKPGASGVGAPTTGTLKQQRESGNAKNTHRKIGSQLVLRRPCDVVGCEVLCEKSRSLVGAVEQCCEMHKREDSFKLKGVEGVFRWCFYCHKPQNIEDFSSCSKSICTEKFLLRKQRRKLASQKQKLLLTEASKTQMETERYVTMEHHQQHPSAGKQEKKAKAKSSSGGSQKKEKLLRTSKEKQAMRALCDIVAEEERREVEGKQCIEKE